MSPHEGFLTWVDYDNFSKCCALDNVLKGGSRISRKGVHMYKGFTLQILSRFY